VIVVPNRIVNVVVWGPPVSTVFDRFSGFFALHRFPSVAREAVRAYGGRRHARHTACSCVEYL